MLKLLEEEAEENKRKRGNEEKKDAKIPDAKVSDNDSRANNLTWSVISRI